MNIPSLILATGLGVILGAFLAYAIQEVRIMALMREIVQTIELSREARVHAEASRDRAVAQNADLLQLIQQQELMLEKANELYSTIVTRLDKPI